MAPPGMATADEGRFCLLRAAAAAAGAQFENWGDSDIVVTSPLTETTCTDADDVSGDKQHAQMVCAQGFFLIRVLLPWKVQRRLAQNREAARKSRMRKKVILALLYHLLSVATCNYCALAFDLEYARWLDEHQRHMTDLRVALGAQIGDDDLRLLVDGVMVHYEQMFRLKGLATRADVFHVLSGMWMSPAERFFMWLGGFRSSELLKVLLSGHVEPLTEQQLVGICSLQQSSQQAEDALSQGMEALQQALADTLAAAAAAGAGPDGVTSYMGQMAVAMGKLATVENFLRQADLLRQQTLQQMRRILTTRQAARALLVVSDYFSRLRALSSLWLTRPRD
ncbi:Transcription factor HBP-1b(c1) [Dichanthelium oligosanthes]|uniref:Transcription factor HBP-1b(C1) n=1 Tax=Dichanthelium oligosanthes TaxID=888268 RepID=A0A1E5UUH0_9POAL|nr:Transcription factor HBP-1b(c1) [Dichanthelium oligosanthes]